MASSILERYERILRADPKSRVFVELARAFLDQGEPERAIALCERGIEHHPDSVVARVLWGKALLAVGRVDDAVRRFEEAAAIEPHNPYGYDLAGEALVRGGHPDRALPLLERGAATHPRDARIQLWLKEANATRGPGAAGAEPPPAPELPPPAQGSPDGTSPPVPTSPVASGGGVGVEQPPPIARPSDPAAAPPPFWGPPPRPGSSNGAERGPLSDLLAALPDHAAATPPEPVSESTNVAVPAAPPGSEAAGEEPGGGGGEATSVAEPQRAPPAGDRAPQPPAQPSAAASYESELRKELSAKLPPPAQGSLRRHLRAILVVTAIVAALAGVATYLIVKARHRESDAHAAADAARKGLARDTLGSLREAQRVLVEARRVAPASAEVLSALAEVSALLAYDFDDAEARATARSLVDASTAGPGTFAARWLLAKSARERDAAAISLLERRDATPLASAITGEILLARHENDAARAAFERAAKANPPLLRAITRLGDLDAVAADDAAALERYRAVLRVQPTHPRAALGAAEMSLALGRDLDAALKAVEGAAADAGSAPPLRDRTRFQVVRARLLAATGRGGEASRVLDDATVREAGTADVALARAEALASGGDLAGAVAAAEAARRAAPGEARPRELVAQLQLRLARYRDLLAGSEADPTRTLRMYRGIARIELGDAAGARAELEATRRDGKMPPEAAAWMAIAELASGRQAHAATVVDALLASPTPHPVALLARARLDLVGGRAEAAERRLHEAIDRDPDLLDARYELGRFLLERGRAPEARDVLEKAVARAPWRASARVALARARLATGDRETAVRELEAVVSERPDDPGALDAARRILRGLQRR